MTTTKSLMKTPSAWLPLLMSFAALLLIVGSVALNGVTQPPPEDEGTVAHIFQILMGSQIFVLTYFAARWLPLNPKQGLKIIAAQVFCAACVFAVLRLLEL